MSLSSRLLPGVPLVESPLFRLSLDEMELSNYERDVAIQLNERGYAVIDFPDDDILDRVDRIKADLAPRFSVDFSKAETVKNKGDLRIQDGWKFNDDVRAIACNAAVIDLLSKLYGRRAFPFQTLNFPVGTQQTAHSDSVHFSSIPERFMCGVWLAMEDIDENSGPLVYYPGSHRWPILYNDMLDRFADRERGRSAQAPYEPVWLKMAEAAGIEPEYFHARKGQALIWAANLLHGGSRQKDLTLTRWSQVTHYYFENCTYYTPAFSDPLAGNLDIRAIRAIDSGELVENVYIDKPYRDLTAKTPAVATPAPMMKGPSPLTAAMGVMGAMIGMKADENELPADFDPQRYYALNSDVAAARADAAQHYLKHGRYENRQYK